MKIKKYKNRLLGGIMLGVLILMSAIPAMAEDITLHNPSTVQAGFILPIRWSYNGSFEPNVTVELLKDGTLIGTIASDTYIGDILNYNGGIPYGEGEYRYWNVSESLGSGIYQLKITGHNTSGLEVTDTNDIEITAPTTENCRSCHGGPASESQPHPAAIIHHLMVSEGRTPLGCSDCHPVINNAMYIESNCLNCHNGTAWYLNPIVNPGQPHLNTVPPPDNTPPVINSIALSDNTPNTGDSVLVTVNATDDALITSITANDVSLTKQSDNIWTGSIIAIEGTHSINISANDVAGHVTWDNSTSYTTTTTALENITLLHDRIPDPYSTQAGRLLPIIDWSYNGSFEPNVSIGVYKDGILNKTITSDNYIGDILYYNGDIPYGKGLYYYYWPIPISLAGTYQLKIIGHTTSGSEITNESTLEIAAATSDGCRPCHGGMPTVMKPYPAANINHLVLESDIINPMTNAPYACPDCHPYINGQMYIESNCLNCHNGTAFWANPTAINPGEPHLNLTLSPYVDRPPVINSITLSTYTPITGDSILVTVNTTDPDGELVFSVTANGVSLTKRSSHFWAGNIIALEGTHSVNVSARDGSAHYTWDNSTSYTATTPSPDTPPVINSVTLSTNTPNTGDNILVTVNATDDVLVTSIVANGISLTKQSNDIWNGSITAIEGTNSVNVSANDDAGYVTWDNSTSYTATTPNIIVTSPMTGDNWVRGTTQTIRWTYTGNLGNSATVELLEQGEVHQTWVNVLQANGVGSLEWAIPSQFEVSKYQVRVSAGGYSNTTGDFNIVKR